ncbi:MAG: hypothetical protein ACLTWM_07335 [Collinsella bouchesdurhonensis]
MSYQKLLREHASETDLQQDLSDGGQVAFTVRIPKNLKDSVAEIVELRRMRFSAPLRKCLVQELAKGR